MTSRTSMTAMTIPYYLHKLVHFIMVRIVMLTTMIMVRIVILNLRRRLFANDDGGNVLMTLVDNDSENGHDENGNGVHDHDENGQTVDNGVRDENENGVRDHDANVQSVESG
eukprot:101885_1